MIPSKLFYTAKKAVPKFNTFQNNRPPDFNLNVKNAVFESSEVVDEIGFEQRLVQIGRIYNLDGVDDFISIPKITNYDFGTGAFTIDLYVRYRENQEVLYFGNNALSDVGGVNFPSYYFAQTASNTLRFEHYTGIGVSTFVESAPITGITNAEIFHVCITRDTNNTVRFFANGVLIGTVTYTTNITTTTQSFGIGGVTNGTSIITSFSGYAIRVFNGSALWTDVFTPPQITSLRNDYGLTNNLVSFYKCDEGSGVTSFDSTSSKNHGTIINANLTTLHGTLRDGNGADFQNQIGYTPAMLFSGTNSWMNIQTPNLILTGEFTFSVRFKTDSTTTSGIHQRTIISFGDIGETDTFIVQVDTNGRIITYVGTTQLQSSTGFNDDDSHLVLISRDASNNVRLFLDGTLEASANTNAQITASPIFKLGKMQTLLSDGGYFDGFLSDVRLIQNTALYTANFDANLGYSDFNKGTDVLLNLLHNNWEESCYFYTRSFNNIVNINIPRDEISTDKDVENNPLFFKGRVRYNLGLVGSNALTFDGSDDFISCPSSVTVGSTFTIHFWAKFYNVFDEGIFEQLNDFSNYLQAFSVGAGDLRFEYRAGGVIQMLLTLSTSEIFLNRWHHFAIVKDGTNAYLFHDGLLKDSITNAGNTTFVATNPFYIGELHTIAGNRFLDFDGQICNFTVVNGTALWTAPFCPPKKYDNLDSNTVMFLPMQERDNAICYDVSGNGNNGTLTNFTIPNAWQTGTLGIISYHNLFQGFEKYTDDATGTRELHVPIRPDGSLLTPTISGWTKQSTHPAGYWHNGAETQLNAYPVPEIIRKDTTNVLFDGVGVAKDVTFDDMVASNGGISTNIVNAINRKEDFKLDN